MRYGADYIGWFCWLLSLNCFCTHSKRPCIKFRNLFL